MDIATIVRLTKFSELNVRDARLKQPPSLNAPILGHSCSVPFSIHGAINNLGN